MNLTYEQRVNLDHRFNPTPEPVRETPVKMTKRLRALCFVERHNECSGVQVPHSAADYFMVCTCPCHEG